MEFITQLIARIRIFFYNFWLCNEYLSVSTPYLYRTMLHRLQDNQSILEVGVGTGIPIFKNLDLIKQKNINIHGIDIDKDYTEYCSSLFVNEKQISIEIKDLFTITETYDVILFSESLPVIPRHIMELMLEHCKTILKPNGKIIFLNNLIMKNQQIHPLALLKPYIKYIPFVWIDFGEAIVMDDFENLLLAHNFQFNSSIIANNNLTLLNYPIYQYMYEVSRFTHEK